MKLRGVENFAKLLKIMQNNAVQFFTSTITTSLSCTVSEIFNV